VRTLGGLLLIAAAGVLAFLWVRGYLSAGISQVLGYFASPPALRPIATGSPSPGTVTPSGTATALGTISNP
jgi:hypothetical protein